MIMCIIFSTLLGLLGAYLIGVAINNYILKSDFSGLVVVLAYLSVLYVLESTLTYLQKLISIMIAQETAADIRRDLFTKLQKLPLGFFDSKTHGEIMSRFTNDIDTVIHMLNVSIAQIVTSVITVSGALVFMLYISPILTLVSLISIPVVYLVTKLFSKHAHQYFVKNQGLLGELNGKIEEIISGQRVVKVFSRENIEIESFESIHKELHKHV